MPNATPSTRLNWEFYAVLSGACSPVFDGADAPALKSGTLWILPPTLRYGWTGYLEGWERVLFHYSFIPDTLKEHIPKNGFFEMSMDDVDLETIRHLARQVEPYLMKPNELSNLMFHRTLIDLSLIALKAIPIKKVNGIDDISYERVERAIAWYNDHMEEAPTIEAVAAAVHVSASHLRRHFQQVKRTSPNKHFQKMRMVRASKLLSKSSDTLEQISRACGFPNSSDFCRAFRKSFGTTPHTWRTRIIPKQPYGEKRVPESVEIATNKRGFAGVEGGSEMNSL